MKASARARRFLDRHLAAGDPLLGFSSAAVEKAASERHWSSWREWVAAVFGHVASAGFAGRHERLWAWLDALGTSTPMPLVEVWPRGGAKSTTTELGVVWAGMNLHRRYVLYVSGTQDQADKHVSSIGSWLLRAGMERSVGRYGSSRGWRRNQLRAANGFNVEAIGLDTAARGIKLEEVRPDLIILDDIDDRNDSPTLVRKKEASITSTILPAGGADTAILFVQNLIHDGSVMNRLVTGRADWLSARTFAGIEPAVVGLETKEELLESGAVRHRIIGGRATWEGQSIEVCQRQIELWGLSAFRREAQHLVRGVQGFFFNEERFRRCDPCEVPSGLRLVRAWDLAGTHGAGDYTVGVLLGVCPAGVYYVLDVLRVQWNSALVRELVRATAERDRSGEIWSLDDVDERGTLVRTGSVRFTFTGKVRLRLPQDPSQAGRAQADQFRADLAAFAPIIVPVSGRGSKGKRAGGWAEAVNDGSAVLVRGAWNHDFTEEHREFREDEEHEYDDQVDACADAYNELRGSSGWVHQLGAVLGS